MEKRAARKEKVDILPYCNSICPVWGSIWPRETRGLDMRCLKHRVEVEIFKTPRLSVGLRLRDTFGYAHSYLIGESACSVRCSA